MLVLSRRNNQEISFPALDIRIRVLKAAGAVKLGIDAPRDIQVLRDEVEAVIADQMPTEVDFSRLPQAVRHDIRNQMQSVTIGLHLMREYLDLGNVADATDTIETVLSCVDTIVKHRAVASPATDRLQALLVDDEPNERELLAGFLRLHGYDVTIAEDGQSAFKHLRAAKPDIVLLDLDLPDMRGETILAWIREQPKLEKLPVFIVSGSEFSKDEAADSAPEQYFQKPLDPRLLVEAMNRQTCMV